MEDLYYIFNKVTEKDVILTLLAVYVMNHSEEIKFTTLYNIDDVVDNKKWDNKLIKFCQDFKNDNPENYMINMYAFAQHTDIKLFRDISGIIANWTVYYNSPVYSNADIGKPKNEVVL